MHPDLDTLITEVPAYLDSHGFATFHGLSRIAEDKPVVLWDTARRPGYQEFLDCADRLGVKVIVLHTRSFDEQTLADLQAEIEEGQLPHNEQRDLERRLHALKAYTGFTAALELSFDWAGAIYMYEVRSEFMNELLSIMNDLDDSFLEQDPGEEGSLGGGFYSRN